MTVLSVALGCANSRRRRRAPRPLGPIANAPPQGDATAIWFGTDDGTRKADAKKPKSKRIKKGRRVVPASRRRGRPGATSPIATNLAKPSLKSRDWIFLDSFKFAGPWESRNRKGKKDTDLVRLDSAGWVQALNYGQQAWARVPTLAGGRMVLLYTGRGIVQVKGAKVLGEGDGRFLIEAKPYSTVTVVVKATNVSDNVRNMKLVPEQMESSAGREAFHPLFVRRLTKYSVLRFADWIQASSNRLARWEDRTSYSAARQSTDNGVAFEFMIQLANEVGADAWINIPYAADDAMIEQLAALVRDNLDNDLKVYVEYSSEVWRPGTPAFVYAQREGQFRRLESDPNLARIYFQSLRSQEIFEIFERTFGDADPRVVRVMGSRAGAGAEHERLLGFERAAERVDVLAIDVRVGENIGVRQNASKIEKGGSTWVLKQLQADVAATLTEVRASLGVTNRYGVTLAAYSGGLRLSTSRSLANNASVQQFFDAASRDKRVRAVYTALLDGWRSAGGALFTHVSFATPFDKTGRDGSIEYIDQPRRVTPKHDALLAFAERNQRWWNDTPKVIGSAPPPPSGPPTSGPPPPPLQGSKTPPPPPAGGGIGQDVEPVSNTGIWAAGGVGAGGVALGWLFTGLYLSAAGDRDVLIAQRLNPPDGTPARDLDNAAYRHSIGTTLGFSLALAGATTALVMSAVSDIPIEDVAEPAMWLSASAGLASAVAGTVFLLASNNTASQRDALMADATMSQNSAPIRTLDNEAFRWGLASAGAYTISAIAIGLATWILFSEPRDPSDDYYLDSYYEEQGVVW